MQRLHQLENERDRWLKASEGIVGQWGVSNSSSSPCESTNKASWGQTVGVSHRLVNRHKSTIEEWYLLESLDLSKFNLLIAQYLSTLSLVLPTPWCNNFSLYTLRPKGQTHTSTIGVSCENIPKLLGHWGTQTYDPRNNATRRFEGKIIQKYLKLLYSCQFHPKYFNNVNLVINFLIIYQYNPFN